MTLVLKHVEGDNLCFAYPEARYKEPLEDLLAVCDAKYNGYVTLTLSKPRRSRTTGPNSQNNLFWKIVTEIAKETGNDICDVEDGIKDRALKRGYPYSVNPISNKIRPYSTTKVDTEQMSYLIDEAYQVMAELGITLAPQDV